jgi:hypothetical protein
VVQCEEWITNFGVSLKMISFPPPVYRDAIAESYMRGDELKNRTP